MSSDGDGPGEAKGQITGLDALYREQERGKRAVDPARSMKLTVAALLQITAAIIGPFSIVAVCAGFCVMFTGGTGGIVIGFNPLLGLLSLAIIILAVKGARDGSRELLFYAGLLGLLQFGPYFLGTLLSLASVVLLRWRK